MTTAYSYLRFSTKPQAEGDSVRRQHANRDRWLEANPKVMLDRTLNMEDKSVSGFRGKHRENPDTHALAAFLKLVEAKKIDRGSYLIVESLDRLTREHIQPALLLILGLLQAGIRIVQLLPVEIIYDDKSEAHTIMLMIVELMRGNSESKMKSERIGSAWQQKKQAAQNGQPQPKLTRGKREGTALLTGGKALPGWVKEVNGKPVPIPRALDTIKRIFKLSAQGFGQKQIVKQLIQSKTPPLERSKHWNASYVGAILRDRRVLGEYQPRTKATRKADGQPIPNYYPQVIKEKEWSASRATTQERWGKNGPIGGNTGHQVPNLFPHLIKDLRDGGNYRVAPRKDEGGRRRVLINSNGVEARTKCVSFPLNVFERAILSKLQELKLKDVIGERDQPDESQVLAGELVAVSQSINLIEQEMDVNGESPTLFKRLRAKEQAKKEIESKLAAARHKAQHPLAESWRESRSLLEALDQAPDPTEVRLRLRSALKRIINHIELLVVVRGTDRLAAVRVHFKGGAEREYLIWNRPPRSNGKKRVEGWWKVRTLKHETLSSLGLRLATSGIAEIEPDATEDYLKALTNDQLTDLVFSNCPAQDH